MAYGGMRGEGVPLGDRALTRAATARPDSGPVPVPQAPTAATQAPAPIRGGHRAEPPIHCWVRSAAAGPGSVPGSEDRSPGVLVEWRHDGSQWWGMVVFVVDDGAAPVVVTRLMPAESLSPA